MDNLKSFMKNGSMMITGNQFEMGSWNCGKGKTFPHIPTNFMILNKISSTKNYLIKKGRTSIVLKMFDMTSPSARRR